MSGPMPAPAVAALLAALQRIADFDADDGDALARIARRALAEYGKATA